MRHWLQAIFLMSSSKKGISSPENRCAIHGSARSGAAE
jgi:hypothetical protein